MKTKNLQLIFEKNFTNKAVKALVTQVIGKIIEQAISLFLKKTTEVPQLPAELPELKKRLGMVDVSDDTFLEELVKFYFKKTKEQL